MVVLQDIDFGSINKGPRAGERALVADVNDSGVYLLFETPHYDWPSQWRNELFVTWDDHEVMGRLKFNPHSCVVDFYTRTAQVA